MELSYDKKIEKISRMAQYEPLRKSKDDACLAPPEPWFVELVQLMLTLILQGLAWDGCKVAARKFFVRKNYKQSNKEVDSFKYIYKSIKRDRKQKDSVVNLITEDEIAKLNKKFDFEVREAFKEGGRGGILNRVLMLLHKNEN